MSQGTCTYCDAAPIAFDELCEDCIIGSREHGRTEERHDVVTFLRRHTNDKARLPSVERELMAQCIERGDHLK